MCYMQISNSWCAHLLHEGLELPEAVDEGLVGQEGDILDVVIRLVLGAWDLIRLPRVDALLVMIDIT